MILNPFLWKSFEAADYCFLCPDMIFIYIYYNEAKLNMKKNTASSITVGYSFNCNFSFWLSLIFLCKSELFDFCNTMPCRWRKVASVEIISLSGVHHLFYDFVFVIVSYTLSFFFRNFKSKGIANNFLNQKTGVLFSKLSERNAWMIPNLGKKTQNLFLFYIHLYFVLFRS